MCNVGYLMIRDGFYSLVALIRVGMCNLSQELMLRVWFGAIAGGGYPCTAIS